MATPAQIAANQRNAQNSTGPITEDGKRKARQNALRHGLCSCVPCMGDETPEEVTQLLNILREEHQPVGATEEILVYKIAEHLWCARRASYLIAEKLDEAELGDNTLRETALFLRYHTTADRGYYKALSELRKIQKERKLAEIGSVPQNAEVLLEELPEAPAEATKIDSDEPAPPPEPAKARTITIKSPITATRPFKITLTEAADPVNKAA